MTIKKHNVIKKLDQYACINPITINGGVITANINGSISFSALKEIQDSMPGWEMSITNEKLGVALVIKQKRSQAGDDMCDAMEAATNLLFNRIPSVDTFFKNVFIDPAFHPMKKRGV